MIGIYIHIPFCRTKCPYCDFLSRVVEGAVPEWFVEALCREIKDFGEPERANTVFLGGGTPSLLSAKGLGAVLGAVRERFRLDEPEVTIEVNPDDVTPELVRAWQALGVNRVSLGVQSFDDATLRYLGRRHDAATARRACERVAAAFENWGMDLILGAYPLDAWDATLNVCVALAPAHVSAYGLTYEKGTPFGGRADEAVDEDTYLEMYRAARERLAGFEHYEISNFARPGRACRHNLIYWRNEAYAGFGPGAYSFLGGVRARNVVDTAAYAAEPGAKAERLRLTGREVRVETVIQHCRLKAGLSKEGYRARFGTGVREDFGAELDALIARGLLTEDEHTIRPTLKGFELNNEIGLRLVD